MDNSRKLGLSSTMEEEAEEGNFLSQLKGNRS